jgi:hypothetical protein
LLLIFSFHFDKINKEKKNYVYKYGYFIKIYYEYIF